MTKATVNLYIDGFNLYFGLRQLVRNCKWLDLIALGKQLCRPNQQLGSVHYFTARIEGQDQHKIKRQSIYLETLETTAVHITHGKFQRKRVTCPECGKRYPRYEEKESDVNLGSKLLIDAARGAADVCLVVSGDSDLNLPMEYARDE